MIEVESLTKKYDRFLAVDNISFAVQKGEIVGLLGPNGAGKTTTMKILTTFLPANSGKVTVGGFDVMNDSLNVRKKIGYLPENCPLYLDMEVLSYLRFCSEIRGIDPKDRERAVQRVVSDCALQAVLNKVIGHLSKGFRQRVGLAQTLLHNPEILILDEPTSGLDPNQIREILKLIHELGKEKTVIHSTHILGEVEATSNRILIIHEGKIVGQGSPRELMAQSRGTTTFVTLRGSDVEPAMKESGFISEITQIKEVGDGMVQYALYGGDGDIAEKVFNLAVKQSWSLKELRTETASLDEVFAQLTRN